MKIMKKAMAFFLCVVMTMAMGISAFAADTKYTITINNETSGYTYTAYQVFTGSLSTIGGKDTLGNIEWSDDVDGDAILTALKASNTLKTGNAYDFASCTSAAEVAKVLADYADDSAKAVAFADIVSRHIKSTATKHEATYDKDSKKYTISGLDEGYYIVVNDTAPAGQTNSRYILQVVQNVSVNPKVADKPDIKKTIENAAGATAAKDAQKKTNTAAIGDTINYKIAGTVPNHKGYNYYYYIVNDDLSNGLTLKEGSFKVTVGGQELTKGTDYYVYTGDKADGHTFQLAFENIMKYNVDAEIVITYDATVNENAVVSDKANTNTAQLQYSNNPNKSDRGDKTDEPGKPGDTDKNPTGEGEKQITKTYTTELELIKVDQDQKRLQGAEFTLTGDTTQVKITTATEFTKADNGEYWKLNDGSYTKDDPNADDVDKTKYESLDDKYTKTTTAEVRGTGIDGKTDIKATVGADGVITFTGLNAGEYTLKETKTPAGYNTAADIQFTISAAYQNDSTDTVGGTVKWSTTGDKVNAVGDKTFVVTVQNNKGSALPSTGGIGTTIFYVVGGLMMAGAAVLLVTKRRMTNG